MASKDNSKSVSYQVKVNGQLKHCHLDQLRCAVESAPTEISDSHPEEAYLPCIPEVVKVPLPDQDRHSPSPVVRTYPTHPNCGMPP